MTALKSGMEMGAAELRNFIGLAGIDLGEYSPKPTSLTEGQVEASVTLWSSGNGSMQVGVWACTEGRFTADRTGSTEVCHFISGLVEMTHLDGTTQRLGAGDLLVLPRGWVGEWNILEPTRKLYIMHSE